MFGFSLTKLLFTIAAVLLVWHGFRWVGRLQERRDATAKEALHAKLRRAAARRPAAAAMKAEEMVKCPACGDYVSARAAVRCGREDCPYPG